jgi:hypothetical protein
MSRRAVCLLLRTLPLVLVVAGPVASREVAAQERSRSGRVSLVLALDGGVQNIIGGAFVAGIDVLSQASRPVGTLSVGIRGETSFGLVAGIEIGLGLARGTLLHGDPAVPLEVKYRNRNQRHWMVLVGQAVGSDRKTLLHVYVSEVSRDFEVEVNEGGARYTQRDGQGLLRFGLGAERQMTNSAALRLMLGTSRADFGGRPTNLTPRRPVDAMVGLVVRH